MKKKVMKKRIVKWKPWLTANCIEICSRYEKKFLARVRVITTGVIPEVPETIRVDGEYFTLRETNPMTYVKIARPVKAERIL